jgi:hypothetical protein
MNLCLHGCSSFLFLMIFFSCLTACWTLFVLFLPLQLKAEHAAFEDSLEAAKRATAAAAKDKLLAEKKLKRAQAERDKKVREELHSSAHHWSSMRM